MSWKCVWFEVIQHFPETNSHRKNNFHQKHQYSLFGERNGPSWFRQLWVTGRNANRKTRALPGFQLDFLNSTFNNSRSTQKQLCKPNHSISKTNLKFHCLNILQFENEIAKNCLRKNFQTNTICSNFWKTSSNSDLKSMVIFANGIWKANCAVINAVLYGGINIQACFTLSASCVALGVCAHVCDTTSSLATQHLLTYFKCVTQLARDDLHMRTDATHHVTQRQSTATLTCTST